MKEIERRFLFRLDDESVLGTAARSRIRQGYLSEGEPAVRIRCRDGAYTLTVKSGRGIARDEVELPVDGDRGAALMSMAGDRVVEKERYLAGRWEIDLFADKLAGLGIAEIELEFEDEPLPPPPPGLALGREVTDDGRFTNQALAGASPEEAAALIREASGS